MKCVFSHKWKYFTSQIPVVDLLRVVEVWSIDNSNRIDLLSRMCEKCNTKEIKTGDNQWHDWDLSIDEKREMTLKELGI